MMLEHMNLIEYYSYGYQILSIYLLILVLYCVSKFKIHSI